MDTERSRDDFCVSDHYLYLLWCMAGMETGASRTFGCGADFLDGGLDRGADLCTDAGDRKLYLAFVTGNLTNLKVPAALTAMENAKVKPGSEEGEVISTIAVATSSIVTTVIIALGVALLVPLTPILNNPAVKPAFDNILPSLFGGLAVVYVSKNWKISVAPLVFMVVLFLLVPSLAGSVGVLVPVGALIAIGSARILYKKGML